MANKAEAKEKKVVELTREHVSKISGEKYIFQKVRPADWLDILDDVEEEKKGKRRRLYGAALEHVVVSPTLTLEDFEDYAELEEVVTAAIRFQQGK